MEVGGRSRKALLREQTQPVYAACECRDRAESVEAMGEKGRGNMMEQRGRVDR